MLAVIIAKAVSDGSLQSLMITVALLFQVMNRNRADKVYRMGVCKQSFDENKIEIFYSIQIDTFFVCAC